MKVIIFLVGIVAIATTVFSTAEAQVRPLDHGVKNGRKLMYTITINNFLL